MRRVYDLAVLVLLVAIIARFGCMTVYLVRESWTHGIYASYISWSDVVLFVLSFFMIDEWRNKHKN